MATGGPQDGYAVTQRGAGGVSHRRALTHVQHARTLYSTAPVAKRTHWLYCGWHRVLWHSPRIEGREG